MLLRSIVAPACAALALFFAGRAGAQEASVEILIAQLRQSAATMQGKLPQADIEEMLRSASELEEANRGGAFGAPNAEPQQDDIIRHMIKFHGSRFEWLIRETACAGYQWETWRVYNVDTGDRDEQRNILCKRAYALFEEYFYLGREGNNAKAHEKLAAYDKAAHAAVDFYERR